MEETRKHNITMENRERLTISSVNEVESFDEEKVVVSTSEGIMTVLGSDFKLQKLNVDDGDLVIEGIVDEIKYSESRGNQGSGGFFAGLFR